MRRPQRSILELLPYDTPMPADARRRPWATAARIAGYAIILGAILTSVIQYQAVTMKNLRDAKAFDAAHPGLTLQQAAEQGLDRPKSHAGAIARWRTAVRHFWEGDNIYSQPSPSDTDEIHLHPNMPFTVILLTPFYWMGPVTMAVVLSLLKVLIILASAWMLVRVANHRELRMPDWVVFLGLFYALQSVIGDLRHGNTNTFVLGAVALHLWLYRKGRDVAAGASLALAVCLKLTPALFGLYWLYQRNWRLLAGLVMALAVFAVVIPAAAMGPTHYQELMGDWLANLIQPGLVKGDWYPIHTNQSLPGTVGRLVLGGPGGNIFWGPDDNPYSGQRQFGWVNVISLSPPQAKWLVRMLQAIIVGLLAWAIGWRKLPRDDGRRMLQYGLIVLGMLILNQRTWDHHAAVLPVATLGVWYAIAFGRFGNRSRWASLVLAIIALPITQAPNIAALLSRLGGAGGKAPGLAADVAEAYGPKLLFFLLMMAATVILCRAMRKADDPYAAVRQKLGGEQQDV
jgi:hypothetical protein